MAETVAQLQVVVSAETEQLTAGLKQASSEVTGFGDSLKSGLGIGLGMTAVTGAIQAAGAAFGALKGSVIDFNQQLDQSRAVFTRYFEGNQATAEAFLTTLKGFAAQTPFEFKDLSTFAIRLQNANTNANDIIPTLKAIGNAASATGNLSTESVDRITLALTQMQMKGKVSGEEMLQLTEANVPAWDILSKATGKSTAELQKMASAGEISASVFTKAFRDMYENAGLMEGASKSLTGALSTVADVGTQAFAEIGRSVFDLATQGANALAGFLSTDDFQTWVQAAKLGVDAVVDAIRGLVASLAPVGEVIATAFHQLTEGDFAGAFKTVQDALTGFFTNLLGGAQAFAQQMYGAGGELMAQYVGGILEGANTLLLGALDTVTSTIAAFLIGQSPPPEGPLRDIAKGGAATIDAWGQGAAGAADKAVKPVADAISGNLAELKVSGRDVEASIRDITRAIQDVEGASRDVKYAADDIKDAYDEQIKAVDDQLKALKEVHDLQREREKLEISLEEVQLRQAEVAAMGDKELRAQLQTRLAQLKASDADRKNAQAMEDAQKAIAGSEKDRLKTQMEAQKLADQERDIRTKLKTAKGPEKDRLLSQLKELEGRKELSRLEAQDREQAAQRRLADATAKQDELSVQQQIDGLVDKTALAQIKAQQEALRAHKEDLSLQEQAAKLERDIAALPLQQQRADLVAEKQALLGPLQEQLENLGKQKQALADQRQEYQNLKADITAATQGIKDQQSAAKDAAKAFKEAADAARPSAVDKSFTPDAAAQAAVDRAKKAGEGLATAFSGGLADMFDRLVPASIRDRLAGVTQQVQTQGLPALLAAIGQGLSAAVPVFASKLAEWSDRFLDWALSLQTDLIAKLDELRPVLLTWIGQAASAIAGKLFDWEIAFIRWVTDAGPDMLDKLAELLGDMLAWAGRAVKDIAGALLDWGAEYVAWLAPRIPELLTELGKMLARLVEWMGQNLGKLLDAIGEWAVEFVEWVAPKIPPLLAELAKLLASLVEWAVTTALPAIAEKLAQWGLALVEWVAPRIGPLLLELGSLLLKLATWIGTEALPAIVLKLAEWGAAFLGWVAKDVIPKLAETLGAILQGVKDWVGQKVTDIVTEAAKLGAGMLEGIQKGLSDNWGTLTDWITENIGKKLPEWMQKMLGIKSPSTVFADIGKNIVLGLIAGMGAKEDELRRAVEKLYDFGPGGGEAGMDMIRAIGKMAEGIGGDEFARAAMAISASETGGGKHLEEIGGTGAQGPFQFDPGGELRNFARFLGVSMTEAAQVAVHQPMVAAKWALEGYLGDAINAGLKKGLSGPALAIYGSRYGQRPAEGNERAAGEWYSRLFPGYAEGGIVTRPTLAWLAERGPEAVVPLTGGAAGRASGYQHVVVDVAIGGRVAEQIVVEGYELAIKRGRLGGLAGAPRVVGV